MDKPHDNLAAALDLLGKGYTPVAMLPGSKVPAEKWRHLYEAGRTVADIRARHWHGIAIITKGIVVIDVDDENKLDAVLERCGLPRAPICRTPSGGFHVHGRLRAVVERYRTIKIHDEEVDLLVGPGLAQLPPTPGYEWLAEGLPALGDLPLCRVGWTRERKRPSSVPEIVVSAGTRTDRQRMIVRARAWAACVEGAVSGQRGHDRTFRLCCRLTHFQENCFGLTFEEAWPILLEWNETCAPPWLESELVHKLQDAIKKG